MKRKNSAPLLSCKVKSSAGVKGAAMHDEVVDDSQQVQLSQSRSSQRDSQLDSILGLQSTQQSLSYVCKQSVATGLIQTTSLKCHFCANHFHGVCLDLPNKSLLDFLYVVDAVGSWTCTGCRASLSKTNKLSKISKTIKNSDVEFIHQEIQSMKSKLEIISDSIISLHKENRINSKTNDSDHRTYAQVASDRSISQGDTNQSQKIESEVNLDAKLRSQILLAVQSEHQQQDKRSSSLVLTGLPSQSAEDDQKQFSELCANTFALTPSIRASSRLEKPETG